MYWNVRTSRGVQRRLEIDGVAQEIDVRSCQSYSTCLVLFQWDSLDHVPVRDAEATGPASPADYFHINSIDEGRDGQLVINSRNTWAAYKVSHDTGRIIWTLGGKHSSFTFKPGAEFAFQHDVRVFGAGDRHVTMFDDEGGPPAVRAQSRGLALRLDLKHRTATVVRRYRHAPALLDYIMGNVQRLPNSHVFVGWGPGNRFSEYGPHGHLLFDARFGGPNSTYRAYRFPWLGTPQTRPAAVASNTSGATRVFASWNGATRVARWRVLGGSTATALRGLGRFAKRMFETAMTVPRRRYFAVQALDRSGHVLGRSPVIRGH